MAFLLNFTKNELPDMFQQPCPSFQQPYNLSEIGETLT